MKRLFGIIFILISLNIYAQKGLDSSWQPALIKFEDGGILEGYLQNFIKNESGSFSFVNSSNSGETEGFVKYRTYTDENPKHFHKKDIRHIRIYEGCDFWHFDKLDIRRLNSNEKPMKPDETTFLLLYYKGQKTNIYLKTFEVSSNIKHAPMYFLNYQDDFVVPYYKINWNSDASHANKNRTQNEVKKSLKWVTRDCPKMIEKIDALQQVSYADNVNTNSGYEAVDEMVQFFDTYHQECKY